MSKKTRNQPKPTQKPVAPPQVAKDSLAMTPTPEAKKGKVGKFIMPINKSLDYANVAMGANQKYSNAPLQVPYGFTTQIPYTNAINSTILANPSPIPVTSYYHVLTTDPVVYVSILYLATNIISRIGDYVDKDEQQQKLVRDTLERIGKRKLLRGLLTKLWAGFSVVKLNWDLVDGVTSIVSIQILPQNSILMASTPEGELDPDYGIMQYYYNINSGWQQSPYAYDSNSVAQYAKFGSAIVPTRQMTYTPLYLSAINKDWRILDTFNPIGLEGNYYGNSLLNQIWSAVTRKNNQLMKLEIATTYKAMPLIVFQTDTQTEVQTASGNYISKAEELMNTLPEASQTGTLISEGADAIKITTIDNTADLDQILATIYACNDEIRTGLVTPNLVGNSGSYANAIANSEANSDIINNLTEDLIYTLREQFIKPVIRNGLDEDAAEFGTFELLDNSLQDKAIWVKILESTKTMGVIKPDLADINFIRNKVGLSPVDSLDDDLVFQMTADILPNRGTNINKTKQETKVPYANGGADEIKKDQYDAT